MTSDDLEENQAAIVVTNHNGVVTSEVVRGNEESLPESDEELLALAPQNMLVIALQVQLRKLVQELESEDPSEAN